MKLNTEQFIQRAKKVHGELYNYSKAVYERSTKKVKIICPVHGPFLQCPENHVNQGQHCPKCANQKKGKHEHFSFEWMLEHPERAYAPALLYVAEVCSNADKYLEIGITTKSLKNQSYNPNPNATLIYLRYMSLKEALLVGEEIEKNLKEYLQAPTVFSHRKTKRFQDSSFVRTTLEQILPKN